MYCGIDIIEVERIKEAIIKNDKFCKKIFSNKEIKEIELIKSNVKYQRYAGRFAAKEAIYKAISNIINENNIIFEFNKIEILNNDIRKPYVVFLDDKLNKVLQNYKIDISISHIKDTATAMCIVT